MQCDSSDSALAKRGRVMLRDYVRDH